MTRRTPDKATPGGDPSFATSRDTWIATAAVVPARTGVRAKPPSDRLGRTPPPPSLAPPAPFLVEYRAVVTISRNEVGPSTPQRSGDDNARRFKRRPAGGGAPTDPSAPPTRHRGVSAHGRTAVRGTREIHQCPGGGDARRSSQGVAALGPAPGQDQRARGCGHLHRGDGGLHHPNVAVTRRDREGAGGRKTPRHHPELRQDGRLLRGRD